MKVVVLILCCLLIVGCSAPADDLLQEQYDQGYGAGYQLGYETGYADALASLGSAPASASTSGEADAPESEGEAQPTENALGSRKNPARLGDTVVCETRDCIANVTLLEVIRGDEAVSIAVEANQFNEYDEGVDLILAKVRIENTEDLTGEDEAYRANVTSFHYADESFAKVVSYATVAGVDVLSVELYEGSSAEGYVCFEGKPDQESDYIIFEDDYWFSLAS